jgi:hypothetical protein
MLSKTDINAPKIPGEPDPNPKIPCATSVSIDLDSMETDEMDKEIDSAE